MYADYLLEVTTRGEIVWEWRCWEHLDGATEVITAQDRREEWTHGNAVAELPDGNLLVSFRNISTVAIVERRTGAIVRKLGSPPLAQQHDPRPLANGNLLIFDNGPHRRDHPAPYSRVIEVDPRRSAIVWEYVNPYFFVEPGRPGVNNWVFRAFRYTPEEIARARRAWVIGLTRPARLSRLDAHIPCGSRFEDWRALPDEKRAASLADRDPAARVARGRLGSDSGSQMGHLGGRLGGAPLDG